MKWFNFFRRRRVRDLDVISLRSDDIDGLWRWARVPMPDDKYGLLAMISERGNGLMVLGRCGSVMVALGPSGKPLFWSIEPPDPLSQDVARMVYDEAMPVDQIALIWDQLEKEVADIEAQMSAQAAG